MDIVSKLINFWFEFDNMSNPGFVMLDNEAYGLLLSKYAHLLNMAII